MYFPWHPKNDESKKIINGFRGKTKVYMVLDVNGTFYRSLSSRDVIFGYQKVPKEGMYGPILLVITQWMFL